MTNDLIIAASDLSHRKKIINLPSSFSGITEAESLLPFSVADVAVRFHSRAVL
jgi:hypothetical protein